MSPSRDRFFAAVRHERPDRVPLDFWARPEIRRQLQEYLRTDDVESALGVDFARVAVREHIPEFERRAEEPSGCNWPGANERYVWHDERTFEDAWGVIHRVGKDGKLIEWVNGPLVDSPDLDSLAFQATSCLADPIEVAAVSSNVRSESPDPSPRW